MVQPFLNFKYDYSLNKLPRFSNRGNYATSFMYWEGYLPKYLLKAFEKDSELLYPNSRDIASMVYDCNVGLLFNW